MNIVIPDPIWGIPDKYWDELRSLGAEVYTDKPTEQSEAIARIQSAEVITVNYLDGNKALIDAAPNLKYIISPAVGYEWINAEYAASKGIKVLNCPTFVPLTVAEHAMGLILGVTKNLIPAHDALRSGVWKPNELISFELSGKNLGLVGYGNIAKHIERMAGGFGMNIRYTNSKSTADELDELLQWSDVVCLCVPLTSATHHLINEPRLKLLKKSAYLINVARGAVIDQSALIASLQNGDFAGAGLDVFDGEPGAAGTIPEDIRTLIALPNVVATPHAAFNTPEALDRKGAEIVANIRSCLANEPQNVVN